MKRPDLIFLSCFVLSLALLIGVVGQNTLLLLASKLAAPTTRAQTTTPAIDIERIKAKLSSAGLVPVEAKYWKVPE